MIFVENFERKENGIRVEFIRSFNINHNMDMIEYLKNKQIMNDFLFSDIGRSKKSVCLNISQHKLDSLETEYFKYCGENYLITTDVYGTANLYKVLIPVYNDTIFFWTKNKKYGTYEALITIGAFEYQCIYHQNGEGTIDVRYSKCDNRHRNKVTISTIEGIHDATNEMFLAAIKQWRENIKKEM